MNTVSLLLLYMKSYTYEMKKLITCYQISFEMFMLSILHFTYMDPHVSKYITYYFGHTVNQILKLSSEIVFQFHSHITYYLFIPNQFSKLKEPY